jgi:polysaccharide biosynthesis/export protein
VGNSQQVEGRQRQGQGLGGGAFLAVAVAVVGAILSGCTGPDIGRFANGYDTDNIILKDQKRIIFPIVSKENYWIQKDVVPEEQFPGPTPGDLKSPEADYILGPGDLIELTVFELMAPGQPYAVIKSISQSGQISFPYLGTVKVSGLTTRGLEEKLADMLDPDYIRDPQVSVFVREYRNLNVAVLTGLSRPGLYPMAKQDMTLLELVAMAGGVIQMVEDYGYVIRKYTPDEVDLLMIESGLPPEKDGAEKPKKGTVGEEAKPGEKPAEKPVPVVAPKAGEKPAEAAPKPAPKAGEVGADVRALSDLEKMAEGEKPPVKKIEAAEAAAEKAAPKAGAPVAPVPDAASATVAKNAEEIGNWFWSDDRWVQIKPKTPVPGTDPAAVPPVKDATGTAVATAEAEPSQAMLEAKLRRLGVVQGAGQLRRIIRFDVRALQAGDPTQNVVLRDGDVVVIPAPPMGDFFMAGEVARPGVYSLTGRKITLLQAVAAAGGLTAVAVPWRTEVVRRLSESEEEIFYVDLYKIARGEVPDFYLQPEDLVRVGTDQSAIFSAVLRNAFRATYGVGGVYDMNFADFYPWTKGIHPLF